MILDASRQNIYEALVAMFAVALLLAVGYIAHIGDISLVVTSTAPLGAMLQRFEYSHPTLSILAVAPLFSTVVLRLSRLTFSIGLYPIKTYAIFFVEALLLATYALVEGILVPLICVLLIAEASINVSSCFGGHISIHRLFKAMLAFGILPLFDGALSAVAIVAVFVAILFLGSLRGAVLSLVGLALPMFAYCYVDWLLGGEFMDGVFLLRDNLIEPTYLPFKAYITLPRMVMGVLCLVLLFATLLYYLSMRLTLGAQVRRMWNYLWMMLALLVVILLLLPSVSTACVLVVVSLIGIFIPMLLRYLSPVVSMLITLIMIGAVVIVVISQYIA